MEKTHFNFIELARDFIARVNLEIFNMAARPRGICLLHKMLLKENT